MEGSVQLLDCTLRDGGFCFEDAALKGWSDICFSEQDIAGLIAALTGARVDIVEIGSVEISPDDKRKYAIYQNIEAISETQPALREGAPLYAALYRGPDTPLADIPSWRPGLCPGVRVILRYSELQKSVDFCAGLAARGYKVFVQPMLTMRYTPQELDLLVRSANAMGAYALYIVDSYGYMDGADVQRLFDVYDAGLDPAVRIGFHAHNNMNLAYANALAFLAHHGARDVIVDACALGVGQGAGNLQTEIIAHHLNAYAGKHYDYSAVLQACETVSALGPDPLWGYSITRFLSAIHKTAYKYSLALRRQYGLPYAEIDRILANMPEDLRHRYTAENTVALLRHNGYQI